MATKNNTSWITSGGESDDFGFVQASGTGLALPYPSNGGSDWGSSPTIVLYDPDICEVNSDGGYSEKQLDCKLTNWAFYAQHKANYDAGRLPSDDDTKIWKQITDPLDSSKWIGGKGYDVRVDQKHNEQLKGYGKFDDARNRWNSAVTNYKKMLDEISKLGINGFVNELDSELKQTEFGIAIDVLHAFEGQPALTFLAGLLAIGHFVEAAQLQGFIDAFKQNIKTNTVKEFLYNLVEKAYLNMMYLYALVLTENRTGFDGQNLNSLCDDDLKIWQQLRLQQMKVNSWLENHGGNDTSWLEDW